MNLLAEDQPQQWGNTLWVSKPKKKKKIVIIITTKNRKNFNANIQLKQVYQPGSMCKNGWWQQRWGWCCVCPADGPAWVWRGNPGGCLVCISQLDPGGIARRCVSGCPTARWRRPFRNERLTRWRRPADACCRCASRSCPAVRVYNSPDAPKICSV